MSEVISPKNEIKEFPLAFAQRQLWFIDQITVDSSGYNILDAYHIHGLVELDALKQSFSVLINRHEALRTRFKDLAGQPVQIIEDSIPWQLSQFDFRELPHLTREIEARKIARTEAQKNFDLTVSPLWRVTLIQLSDQDYWLVFTIHHIIFDGWSSDLFWHELMVIYEAITQGQPYSLGPNPSQLKDFVSWQQKHLQGKVLEDLLQYWKQKLTGPLLPLELPTDFSRPAQPSYQGNSLSIQLPEALTNKLRILSKRQQSTLFITFLTAFKILLFRYTKQSNITIGTPFACRSQLDLEKIVGFLVNTLVLQTELDDKQCFLESLAQVRTTALEAYEHGNLPFDILVETLKPERDLSYNPLFQVMFVMPAPSPEPPKQSTLTYTPISLETYTAIFDLTMEIIETPTGLVTTIEYSDDLFLPNTINLMLEHYQVLLEQIVADPHQPIGKVSLLTPTERQKLLDVWCRPELSQNQKQTRALPKDADLTLSIKTFGNEVIGELFQQGDLSNADAIATILEEFIPHLRQVAADASYSPPEQLELKDSAVSQLNIAWSHLETTSHKDQPIKCLHRYFEDRVRLTSDKVAVSNIDQQLTYAELNAKANQLAHFLIEWGVQADMPIGLSLERSVEVVVAILAILKSGAGYLPLDPEYPPERLRYMIEDAQIPLVLTQDSLKDQFPHFSGKILCVDADHHHFSTRLQTNPSISIELKDLVCIIYTSGSTGKPKGVMLEHQAVSHYVRAAITLYDFTASDCLLQFGSISFDLALEEIFTSLSAGASLRLRTDDMLSSSRHFLQSCQEWGITIVDLPTAYWHQFIADLASTQAQFPPALRLIIVGGERMLPSLVKTWQKTVGDYPRLLNSYGPTETTVAATGFWITHEVEIRQDVPIGRPYANTEIYVLDDYHQLAPIGTPGELYIGGHSLARGYLNRPDLTQLKFIAHPFKSGPNARLYKTGDRVRYLPNGNLEFLGRIDKQVKIRGFRIELGEIETALLQYPGIRETTVIARADKTGNQSLCAYIVEQPEQSVSESALRGALKQHLPTYMVPAAIITLEALPLTPNGKVDVQALPIPSSKASTQPPDSPNFIAPRTPLEDTLAKIWSEVLELPEIGIQDGFFALGGHSLQAVQVMTRIMNELEVELPLSALFQAPTIAEMADILASAGAKVSWTPLVALQAQGDNLPFFAIHGGHGEILFYEKLAHYLGNDQPFYALRARGNDYPETPHRCVEEMAACYIDAIKKVQPKGPYRIGGASFGGIIAFEIAQQLYAQNQETELLVLFDTGGFDEQIMSLPLAKRILNVFRYIPKNGIVESLTRLKLRVLKLFIAESAVEFYRTTGELPDPSSPTLATWEAVMSVNREAANRYKPKIYPGSVTLLRAMDDGTFFWNEHEPDYGWKRHIQGHVNLHNLPGTHIGIFQEPYVQDLANKLNELLNPSETSHKTESSLERSSHRDVMTAPGSQQFPSW